ncbi:MAG: hypothetical protein ACXVFU_16840 [Nocardioidaceae bacterium]
MRSPVRPSAARRWSAGALLVGLGWLASPQAVPVYDGVGLPDQPYRYVTAPSGQASTPPPTSASASTPVANGKGTAGMSAQTAEQGPQASVFVPPYGLAAPGGTITLSITPQAPTDAPKGATVDGNVYAFDLKDPAGPVTLTPQASIATLYLRATTARQPGPTMYRRAAAGSPWTPLATSRGGQDVYVAAFPGPGQYVLAFTAAKGSSGTPVLPLVLGGLLTLLVVVVLVVRLRASGSAQE